MPPLFVSSTQSCRAVIRIGLSFFITGLCVQMFAQDRPSAIAPALQPPVSHTLAAQTPIAQTLITQAIDETQLTVLKGNTHPLARPEFDLGTAPATLPMQRMLLVLKRTPDQEYALRQLLDNQQDKHSASYHQWMTPEQFGEEFGPTDSDLQAITTWLESHGFQVGTTKGRTVLEFSGSASQVQETFHTAIHGYLVNGEQHWANANDPSIPTALVPAVAGVLTLHNFIKKPTLHFTGEPIPAHVSKGNKPQVTFPGQNGQAATNALAPQDYAVIYNINPTYRLNYTGSGIRIGVVGRSNLYNAGQDVTNFYTQVGTGSGFNSFPSFSIVLNGPDPGDLGSGEESEATLDSTWSGAIAPRSSVRLVVSATTNTTDGVDLSETYIVENNLTDVMTESFSSCELYATDAQLAGATALAEQAAAQGITYFVSTGDNGAEGCDDAKVAPATHPISVNFLASTAFNVAVGGTMFNENGDPGKYWSSTAPISETALSYIPEDVWNASSLTNELWSGSGGASAGNIQSGVGTTAGVPKPSWQYGVEGIPADGVRDLPDVSLTAAGHDPYLLCLEGSCVPNDQGDIYVHFISGTSASAPSFAGIMALIDQGAGGRVGLANYPLYQLAIKSAAYPAQCNASSTATPPANTCVFNDVTAGNNVVPGELESDYQAGAGYDLATGLGSVNVANLQAAWSSVTFSPTSTTLTLNGGQPVNITHGQSLPLDVTVAPNSGSGTPTGEVTLLTGSNELAPSTMELFPLSGGQAIGSTSDLPGNTNGSTIVWAHYSGDTAYAPSNSRSFAITVSPETSTTTLSATTVNRNQQSVPFTNGPFGSLIYLRALVAGESGHGFPSGTVTFTDTFGAIPGGNAFTLNNQGATSNPHGVSTFDAGTHTISASYNGDASFKPSATTQSQTFTITPGFFAAIPAAQQTVTIATAGATATSSLAVYNSTGFSGTITFACTGLPSESQCAFSPAAITANGAPGTSTVTITLTTTAATTSSQMEPRLDNRGWINRD